MVTLFFVCFLCYFQANVPLGLQCTGKGDIGPLSSDVDVGPRINKATLNVTVTKLQSQIPTWIM